jgi:hypothetical protein
LFISLLLVVVSQRAHRWARDQFPNICEKTLTILMTPIGSEGECGIPQATEIPYGLTVSGTPKSWILLNGFFQLRVRDLTFRPSLGGSNHPEKNGRH